MADYKFKKSARLAKKAPCSCGSESKLIKRTNYPHGRKSGGVCFTLYKCEDCKKEVFMKASDSPRRF